MSSHDLHSKLRSKINTSEKAETGILYLDVESCFGMLIDCFSPPLLPK